MKFSNESVEYGEIRIKSPLSPYGGTFKYAPSGSRRGKNRNRKLIAKQIKLSKRNKGF
jgi:hypothetical protein